MVTSVTWALAIFFEPTSGTLCPGRRVVRFAGGCAPPNPAPLAAAGVRGELRINATRWQTNEEPNTKELTSSPKTGPEKFEFSGGRSSPKKEENRDEKETQ